MLLSHNRFTALEAAVITFLMCGKFFGAAAFAILYVYAAELFPTVVRNVGVGSSSMCARIGGIIQPQIQLLVSVCIQLYFRCTYMPTFPSVF